MLCLEQGPSYKWSHKQESDTGASLRHGQGGIMGF